MDLKTAIEMTEALDADSHHGIATLGAFGDDVARTLLARVLELEAETPEGCTPTDARVLREANHALAAERDAAIIAAVTSVNVQLAEHGIDMRFDPSAFI